MEDETSHRPPFSACTSGTRGGKKKRKETKTLMEENTCKMVYAFAGVVNRHLSVKAGTLDASQS